MFDLCSQLTVKEVRSKYSKADLRKFSSLAGLFAQFGYLIPLYI